MTTKFKRKIISATLISRTKYSFRFVDDINFYISKIPSKLYKYRSFEANHIDSLENEYLFLSDPKNLDDIYELESHFDKGMLASLGQNPYQRFVFAIIVNTLFPNKKKNHIELIINDILSSINDGIMIRVLIAKLQKNPQVINKREADVLLYVLTNFNERLRELCKEKNFEDFLRVTIFPRECVGIGSLCKDFNNSKLWELYAAKHTGFCIEYDCSDSVKNEPFIYPTIYENEKKNNFCENIVIICVCLSLFNFYDYKDVLLNNLSVFYSHLITKDYQWAYQNEWRIVGDQNYKQSLKITKVYMGKDISPENKKFLEEICKRKNIPLFQMYEEDNTLHYILYNNKQK